MQYLVEYIQLLKKDGFIYKLIPIISNRVKRYFILAAVALSGLLSGCDMMEGLYDDPAESEIDGDETEYHTVVDGVRSGQYYIDATSYTQWIYINLHGEQPNVCTAEISMEDYGETGKPDEWDFALHRYDVKTNGAEVMMTPYRSIEELLSAGMPSGEWVADEYSEEALIVDMSHMLELYLVYAPGYVNKEASKWLDVNIGTLPDHLIMPPIYTMRDNVMLYRFADGTYAAIQLVNYVSNDRYQAKGWMTVKYQYPVFAR